MAERFDEEVLKSMIEPIVIALATTSVKQFLGNLLRFLLSELHIYTYISCD